MKDDVIELAKLFDEGLHAYNHLNGLYNVLVPNRFRTNTPQQTGYVERSGGVFGGIRTSMMIDPNSEPEHRSTIDLLQNAKTYVDKWVADVRVVLEKTGKARYKVQFNDPDGRVGLRAFGNTTRNEEELGDILDDLELRLGELRKIIIDYEQSFENVTRDSNESVEPASYDPKTRTLLFADEAIRFKKDAPFTPALCGVVFSKPDRLWTLKELQTVWDDLYEYLGNERPTDWHRVYEAFNRLNERVRKMTGIDDLFVFSTKSVRLNKKYLAKKSQ